MSSVASSATGDEPQRGDRRLLFITHPEVSVDGSIDVTRWGLSEVGRSRMAAFARSDEAAAVATIASSTERKAVESAAILAARCDVRPSTYGELGENDRSSTGFLPPSEFESTADAFFANPSDSIRGWERAVDAQTRIVHTVRRVAAQAATAEGDVAVVSHGAVGTLLLCHLAGEPIDRAHDQPSQGHFFAASLSSMELLHRWRPIQ